MSASIVRSLPKDPNIPRRLNRDDIIDILEGLPKIKGSNVKSTDQSNRSVKQFLFKQLKGVVITPLAIPEFKQEIYRQFNKSVIKPGTMVGANASDATSAPIMQMTLNTFHFTGAAKNVTAGFEAIREIIKGTAIPKNPSCTVQFKNRHLSYDDILENIKPSIVGLILSRLIEDHDIQTWDELLGEGEPYWYKMNREILGHNIPTQSESNWVMRIVVNVNDMYKFRVNIIDFMEALTKEDQLAIKCVYSPVVVKQYPQYTNDEDGEVIEGTVNIPVIYVDIFPSDQHLKQLGDIKKIKLSYVSEDNIGLIYLKTIMEPSLDLIRIKGIPGIENIFPVEAPVWQIIYTETLTPGTLEWELEFDPFRARMSGIGWENVVYLFETINRLAEKGGRGVVKIHYPTNIQREVNTLRITLPPKNTYPDFDEIVKTNRIKDIIEPHNLVMYWSNLDGTETKNKLKENRDIRNELLKTDRKKGIRFLTQVPTTDFYRASKYVYADTNGSNMSELMNRDDVDPYHTYGNNMYDILSILGVEATRNYLIWALNRIFVGSGQPINTRHILLMVDNATFGGGVTKATFSGITKLGDVLAAASHQQGTKILSNASVFGSTDPIESVAAGIFTGKHMDIGSTIDITPEIEAKIMQMYNSSSSGSRITIDPQAIADAQRSQDEALNDPETFQGGVNIAYDDVDALLSSLNLRSINTDDQPEVNITERYAEKKAQLELKQKGPEIASELIISPLPTQNKAIEQITKNISEIPCEQIPQDFVIESVSRRRRGVQSGVQSGDQSGEIPTEFTISGVSRRRRGVQRDLGGKVEDTS